MAADLPAPAIQGVADGQLGLIGLAAASLMILVIVYKIFTSAKG